MNHVFFRVAVLGSAIILPIFAGSAQAASLKVIYNFTGGPDGTGPRGTLVRDSSGAIFGATKSGGAYEFGTVFKVSATGKVTSLHVFSGAGGDGSKPEGGVIADAQGNLYGTTSAGGENGLGIVFKITPTGAEKILYTFQGICCGSDGSFPMSALVANAKGNMYGTTYKGGNSSDLGTVFKVTPRGAETLVYAFAGGTDGANPGGGLAIDNRGNFYGASYAGGTDNVGVVYRIASGGAETVLHTFSWETADGSQPNDVPVIDDHGNMYGTTLRGGMEGSGGYGTVYRVTHSGVETIVHTFDDIDGADPTGVILVGKVLYGVAAAGGANGLGTIFKLKPNGGFKVLHSFDGTDGSGPACQLISDGAGTLYGTTTAGGTFGFGTLFKLTLK